MKLPPALSWMHLFPRDVSYECDASALEWMRALVHSAKSHSGRRTVSVGSNKSAKCDGFVGINSQADSAQLAEFSHVRRFAVLPDLQSARWYVPLDSPALSCAAFSLYSPARFSARLKVLAAKTATYLRLPIWYRDQIVIAQRTAPPIEHKLAELFPGRTFRVAISSGAPEPARNRKVSFAVIAMDGTIIGFGKIAGSELSNKLMHDECRALPELAGRGIGAPELLFAGDVDGTFVTLQKPLRGRNVSPKLGQDKLALLRSMRSDRLQPACESNLVATLLQRISDLPIPRPELDDALEEILPILEQTRVPSTIIHGDFAPWNLRADNGKVVAFDWEYAELDGLPLFDETHYRLQVGYLLDSWDIARACAALEEMQLHNDLSLSIAQVRAIQAVYLIDNLTRLFAEGYDEAENDMVGWYLKLLGQLVPGRKELVGA
jgi:hypothetical protein